jgi:hypothetical protein
MVQYVTMETKLIIALYTIFGYKYRTTIKSALLAKGAKGS